MTTAALIIPQLLLWWWIPETPRWLITKHKWKPFSKIARQALRLNRDEKSSLKENNTMP